LSGLHHYIYDADGQRLMKSSVPMSYSSVNAQQLQATNSIAAQDYTVYVSAGLVYESNRGSTTYTKHYYAGPLRVASQIGSANPNYETHPVSGGNIAPGGPVNSTPESYGVAVLSDLNTLLANYGMAVDANEPPHDTLSMQVINDPDECRMFYGDDLIEENRCLCDNFPDIAIQQGIDCNPYTPIYWYHPDYIGNVEFVTDRTGQPYQHFYYAAFGDPMVSQHVGTGSFNSAFRFNAKEYDEETGNYYYGARYYEPKSSIWMGVDAMATSYPGINPYNFVTGNPIMAIDPDGNAADWEPDGKGGWIAQAGDNAWTLHKDAGISYSAVVSLMKSQGFEFSTNDKHVHVNVGDAVHVPIPYYTKEIQSSYDPSPALANQNSAAIPKEAENFFSSIKGLSQEELQAQIFSMGDVHVVAADAGVSSYYSYIASKQKGYLQTTRGGLIYESTTFTYGPDVNLLGAYVGDLFYIGDDIQNINFKRDLNGHSWGVSYNAGVGLADGGVLVTYSPSLHTNGSFIGIYVQGSVGPSLPLVPFPLFHSIDTKILTK
ncbi:MAG: RHS repeat-associated core domain-containing protein, partial [Schleiferiaceae bacterium]|nr:RHS repeat-associated core domain-containing protein [Schleiferiaceae bacterium]